MSAIDRRDLRETTALVLLGLMCLVGGAGHGLHAILGCTHGLAQVQASAARADLIAVASTGDGPAVEADASADARGNAACAVCTLLSRFRAAPPALCAVLDLSPLVARSLAPSDPGVDEPWTELYRPRGPPLRSRAA